MAEQNAGGRSSSRRAGDDHGMDVQQPATASTAIASKQDKSTVVDEVAAEKCAACNETLLEGARFCRHCGAEIGAADPTTAVPPVSTEQTKVHEARGESCPSCHAALRPGAHYCRECGAPRRADGNLLAATPPPQASTGGSSAALIVALVIAGLLLLTGIGAGGYFAVAAMTDDPPALPSTADQAAAEREIPEADPDHDAGLSSSDSDSATAESQDVTRSDSSGFGEGDSTAGSSNDSSGKSSSGSGSAANTSADSSSDSDSSASAEDVRSGSADAAETPTDAIRLHWEYIAQGEYDAAYDLFYSGYSSSRSRWVRQKNAAPPDVDIDSIEVADAGTASNGDTYVQVAVITHDPGRDRCNRVEGRVRAILEAGSWRYKPAKGKTSSFRVNRGVVGADDERCARIAN